MNYLSGSVKLTKKSDLDKNKYRGDSIGFDSRSFTDGSFENSVIVFGADMSLSLYINNKGKIS